MKGEEWLESFLQDDSKMPTRWPEHQGVSESAGTYADGWNACYDAMSAAQSSHPQESKMKDVTNKLTPELASLAEEFRKLDVFYAYTIRTIKEKMPIFASHCTDRELKQIINIVIDAYVDTDEATKAENEACAELAERNPFAQALDIAFAIRARIAKDKP